MSIESKSGSSEPLDPLPLTPIVESATSRAKAAIALLDDWLADESGYDERTWPELKVALDRDRLSSRRLFDG
jgi:hypothetical protein